MWSVQPIERNPPREVGLTLISREDGRGFNCTIEKVPRLHLLQKRADLVRCNVSTERILKSTRIGTTDLILHGGNKGDSLHAPMSLPSCPRNTPGSSLELPPRVGFTKEKMPWCPCYFKNEAYRAGPCWNNAGTVWKCVRGNRGVENCWSFPGLYSTGIRDTVWKRVSLSSGYFQTCTQTPEVSHS